MSFLDVSSNLGSFPLFLQIFSLTLSLSSFWDFPNEYVDSLGVSQVPWALLTIFQSFLFFCFSDSIFSIVLSSSLQIISSSCSKFFLNPSSEFFILVTELVAPEFLFHFFFFVCRATWLAGS